MDIIELLKKAYNQGSWNEADKELKHSFDDFLKENKEAINYIHCCKSDSELLCDKQKLSFALDRTEHISRKVGKSDM